MSLTHSPRIVNTGLVLALDAANANSNPGVITANSAVQKTVFITATGAGTYIIPADFGSLVSVEAIGAGGGGGWTGSGYGGGAGGGAYAGSNSSTITSAITPGSTMYYNVGSGGAGGLGGTAGGDTWINFVSNAAPTLVTQGILAKGGAGGASGAGVRALGGQAAASIGAIKYSGGRGAGNAVGAPVNSIGGGGGAGGPFGPGGDAGFGNGTTNGNGGGGGAANGGGSGQDGLTASNTGGTGGINRLNNTPSLGNTGAAGSPGINGGGGSGGAYGFVGGAGSQDSIWTQTSDGTRAGPGSGPGAGSGGPNGGAIVGYGAGAAGYNLGGSANIKGGNGIIVLTYSLSGPIAVSSWKDVSGNDNHSTVVGNAVYATTGGIGSLQFNGVSQYAVAPNSSSLQITTGTIGAWFKANNTNAGYNGIIAKQNAWGLFVMDNILVAYDWGNVAMRTTGITVGNDTWNFVAMSFTETKGTPANNAIVYLNGTAVLTTTVKHLAHDVTVQVGEANASQFFGGNISMAFVYNRVLSAQEIQQNFNAMRARFGI